MINPIIIDRISPDDCMYHMDINREGDIICVFVDARSNVQGGFSMSKDSFRKFAASVEYIAKKDDGPVVEISEAGKPLRLTPREQGVLLRVLEGETDTKIAGAYSITRARLQNIKAKLVRKLKHSMIRNQDRSLTYFADDEPPD